MMNERDETIPFPDPDMAATGISAEPEASNDWGVREAFKTIESYIKPGSALPGAVLYLKREIRKLEKMVMEESARASEPPSDAPMPPIAKLIVSDDDAVRAVMYAPGLPPGEHDLYPEGWLPDDHRDQTITSLCDRIERIFCIAIDQKLTHVERIKQIQEWSAGFMQPPSETKSERTDKCFADCGDNCQCEKYPPQYCKGCSNTVDQCICTAGETGDAPIAWRRLLDNSDTLKPQWHYTHQQPTISPEKWQPVYARAPATKEE